MCDQQRLRPACAYAQSDQSLGLSLEYPTSVKLLTEHHLESLSLKGGCTASSESTHVKMPHCWKSHVAAHIHVFISQKANRIILLKEIVIYKHVKCKGYLHYFVKNYSMLNNDSIYTDVKKKCLIKNKREYLLD